MRRLFLHEKHIKENCWFYHNWHNENDVAFDDKLQEFFLSCYLLKFNVIVNCLNVDEDCVDIWSQLTFCGRTEYQSTQDFFKIVEMLQKKNQCIDCIINS